MDKNKVIEKIYSNLQTKGKHALKDFCTLKYYIKFWNCIELLCDNNMLNTKNKLSSFCTKMQLGKEYKIDKYYQGISEMLFWIYDISKKYSFEVDKKLRVDDNTDIDVQIREDDYTFNIEIKCPKVENVIKDPNKLKINTCFRSLKKDEFSNTIDDIKKFFECEVVDKSEGKYDGVEISKLNDNRIITFLKSAQDKFINSDNNSINILVISLQSSEMQDYWGYIHNQFSGIFTKGFDGQFWDKNNNLVKHSDFDKVDVIYLTNIVSGHVKPSDTFNSWDLGTYCNLICFNPFCSKGITSKDIRKIFDLLPNDNLNFESLLMKKQAQSDELKTPLEGMCVEDYLYNNYNTLR